MKPINVSDRVLWGIVIHLICDWLLQNDWMATNKTSLKHPAAWAHSGLHVIGLLMVFPKGIALSLGLLHALIDTRKPLAWWRRIFQQTTEGPAALHVAIWGDQVAHIAVIALASLLSSRIVKR